MAARWTRGRSFYKFLKNTVDRAEDQAQDGTQSVAAGSRKIKLLFLPCFSIGVLVFFFAAAACLVSLKRFVFLYKNTTDPIETTRKRTTRAERS